MRMAYISKTTGIVVLAGQCGRGPNAIALPREEMAFSLGRDLDVWTALTQIWKVDGVDEALYQSVVVRNSDLDMCPMTCFVEAGAAPFACLHRIQGGHGDASAALRTHGCHAADAT